MYRGFSTLEILIAMTVLVMCFSATMLLLPGIQDATAETERANDSLGIAKRLLEEEQAKARKDFKLVISWEGEETVDGVTYETRVLVEQFGSDDESFVTKKVTVEVIRDGLFGREDQSTELSTIVTNFEQIVGGDTCYSVVDEDESWGSPQVTNRLLGANILGDSSTNYPLSDLDAYYHRLYATVRGSSGSQGAFTSDVAANTTTIGTLAWSNADNGRTSNNSYATRTMSGSSATNYLYVRDFDFDIPDGATILGIRVDIERSRSSGGGTSNNIRDNAVRLVNQSGVVVGDNRAKATSWPSSDNTETYGGVSDLWGEEWTAAKLNDQDFGVVLSAIGVPVSGGQNRNAQVDAISVTVTYIPQFYRLAIDTPTNPTLRGELTTATTTFPVSAGFNAIAVATSSSYGQYAFAALNSTASHLQVIDLSGTDPKIVESYQVPGAGSAVANALYYKDGYVYLGLEASSGDEFYVIDVHNPLNIPAPLSSLEIGSGINAIYVEDDRAYLATNDTSRELVIVDLSVLSNLSGNSDNNPPLFYNASGASPGQGRSLYTVGDTLYLGRYYSSNGHEFFALNTASTPASLGSIDIGTSVNTMGVYGALTRGALAFLLTGNTTSNNNGRVQVYNIENPGSMSSVSSITLPNSGSPSAIDCEGAYLYTASTPVSGGSANKGSISIISAP